MKRYRWIAVALIITALLGTIVAQRLVIDDTQRKLNERETTLLRRTADSARRVVDTIEVQMAAQDRVLTRTLTRVRVDTLMVAPSTPAETTTAVRQLGALAIEHDSLQRSCSAFKLTCAEYRVAAERRDTAQQKVITNLTTRLTHERPSRLRAAWDAVDQYVYFAGGVCAGALLSGHSCLP